MVQSVLPETFKKDEFLTIFIFNILFMFAFFIFWGRRHEALAFKSAPCPLAHQCVLGRAPVAVDFAEVLVFVKIIVLLTSLTGRLLRLWA